jgi:hypothetical protein
MRRIPLALLLVTVALLALPQNSVGAGGGKHVELRKLMTPAQFNQAGLTKLTPPELLALEEWLGVYTEAVAQVCARAKANPKYPTAPSLPAPVTSPQVIETCIEDEFEGWEGETIFTLCNGQIWQQSEYAYMYHYSYRPDVVIYRTSSGYRMKVEDVSETIGVERIK